MEGDPLTPPRRADRIIRFTADAPAVRVLRAADPALRELIDAIGPLELKPAENRFRSLAVSITSQQLSVKAADTIWRRVEALGPVTPESVVVLPEDALRAAGLSRAKATYLRDLADAVLSGRVDLEALDSLDDASVVREVTLVKGIGRWTAEMFLIFALGRPDVLALDDAGLQRSAGRLVLGLPRSADRQELEAAGAAWAPHRTAASLYLWAALDRGLA